MKKKIIIAICVVLGIALIAGIAYFAIGIKTQYDNTTDYGKYKADNDVELVAHRGFSAAAPENTAAAFRKAGEVSGFYGCECDIQLTADNVWVIFHDEKLERMTDGEGKISDFTFEQLSLLTIDSGNNVEKYSGEKIPTLEQYLDICQENGLRAFIEIKMDADAQQVQSLYDILQAHNMQNSCTVISFYHDSLKSLRAIDKSIEIYALSTKIKASVVKLCEENDFGLDFCESEKSNTVKKINELHEKQIPTAAWTITEQAAYDRMVNNGVNLITCNSPDFYK